MGQRSSCGTFNHVLNQMKMNTTYQYLWYLHIQKDLERGLSHLMHTLKRRIQNIDKLYSFSFDSIHG